MEVLRYISGWQIHHRETLVAQSRAVTVVQVVCIHLCVPFAFRCVQDIVDSHTTQEVFILCRYAVGNKHKSFVEPF